jgi:hypothetical protein
VNYLAVASFDEATTLEDFPIDLGTVRLGFEKLPNGRLATVNRGRQKLSFSKQRDCLIIHEEVVRMQIVVRPDGFSRQLIEATVPQPEVAPQ